MLITNIQRFSLHDGPGIRTTIFLKGCSLRCPWCSNPENLNAYPEKYYKNGIEGSFGRKYTCDEVYEEVIKDRVFYESDGGVTFSGGEALLYVDEIMPLIVRLRKEKISVAVETALFVPTEELEKILPYVDYFYVDMKILDKKRCRNVLNGDLDLYYTNLDLLASQKMVTIRIPVIGKYTDDDDNMSIIVKEIKMFAKSILKVELIKGHNLGESKYRSLGMSIPQYYEVTDALLNSYKKKIQNAVDIRVDICKV